MKLDNLKTTEQIELFLNGSQAIAFSVASSRDERYQFVESVLKRLDFLQQQRSLLFKHIHENNLKRASVAWLLATRL